MCMPQPVRVSAHPQIPLNVEGSAQVRGWYVPKLPYSEVPAPPSLWTVESVRMVWWGRVVGDQWGRGVGRLVASCHAVSTRSTLRSCVLIIPLKLGDGGGRGQTIMAWVRGTHQRRSQCNSMAKIIKPRSESIPNLRYYSFISAKLPYISLLRGIRVLRIRPAGSGILSASSSASPAHPILQLDGDAGGWPRCEWRAPGGGDGGGADPGVLALLLDVPLLLGGALGASWRGEPAITAAGAHALQ